MRRFDLRACFLPLAVVIGVVSAVPAACGSTERAAGSTSSGTTTTSSGSGGAGGAGGGGLQIDSGLGGSSACAPCSADLHKVVDCNGQTVMQCTDDQGCANGQCIADPCVAAQTARSSTGCDYWALETDIIDEAAGACFAAFVANTWTQPVHLQVDYLGKPLPVSDFARIPKGQGNALTYDPYDDVAGLAPGDVAILFLSRKPGGLLVDCPVPPAVAADAAVHGTGRGSAFHITTDRPVVAYQILPYGGGSAHATSASLLLPTSAWDTNYVVVNAYPKSQVTAQAAPSLDVLAVEDATTVTLGAKAAIVGGPGVASAGANTLATYVLNRGEYVQITQDAELTGSPLQSDKPVALWGGASCLNVPVDAQACDSAQQQIPPVRALGSEYAAVRYRGRAGQDEAPPWRIVGAVDGTKLKWTPSTPPGAPVAIGLGEVHDFYATGPFVVSSQDAAHPFYASAYMTGGKQYFGEGDPEWVNIVPTAQYLDSYVFFTDPTYSETSLVIVRKPSQGGKFADVTLDCAGTLSGWKPLGAYEYARVSLVTGDFQNVGGCSNGRHHMESAAPFGVTVWGWGSVAAASLDTTYVSYAYPAGASIQSINEVVVTPK